MKIFVAGHRGMVGSAILRLLEKDNYYEIIVADKKDLNLTIQEDVNTFFEHNKPDRVILAAAKVGGIFSNNHFPADFIYQNLMIQSNVIEASFKNNVERLLFLGSSCIYPKEAEQPMQENQLLQGSLEKTNEPYAIAKIAGIKLCESYNRQYKTDYRSIMPTNLYGPGDNFHDLNSHVIPGLLARFHEAKIKEKDKLVVWGSGQVYREFLHVDDMASASIYLLTIEREKYLEKTSEMLSHINAGSGDEIKICDLATLIAETVGYNGEIIFDLSKPDGPVRKLMDSSLLRSTGWNPSIELKQGLEDTYEWYQKNI